MVFEDLLSCKILENSWNCTIKKKNNLALDLLFRILLTSTCLTLMVVTLSSTPTPLRASHNLWTAPNLLFRGSVMHFQAWTWCSMNLLFSENKVRLSIQILKVKLTWFQGVRNGAASKFTSKITNDTRWALMIAISSSVKLTETPPTDDPVNSFNNLLFTGAPSTKTGTSSMCNCRERLLRFKPPSVTYLNNDERNVQYVKIFLIKNRNNFF